MEEVLTKVMKPDQKQEDMKFDLMKQQKGYYEAQVNNSSKEEKRKQISFCMEMLYNPSITDKMRKELEDERDGHWNDLLHGIL